MRLGDQEEDDFSYNAGWTIELLCAVQCFSGEATHAAHVSEEQAAGFHLQMDSTIFLM